MSWTNGWFFGLGIAVGVTIVAAVVLFVLRTPDDEEPEDGLWCDDPDEER